MTSIRQEPDEQGSLAGAPKPENRPTLPPPRPAADDLPVKRRKSNGRDDMSPAERALRARLAAHASWARTTDPAARTAPARAAFLDRFDRQVDPEGVLAPAERARRAEHARRAYFLALAAKAASARRAKRRIAQRSRPAVSRRAEESTENGEQR